LQITKVFLLCLHVGKQLLRVAQDDIVAVRVELLKLRLNDCPLFLW
jgi:hypothetical protein